ncbi:hypothetical protein STAN_2624 [Streptomyces sp. CBMAI 2042]|nr:hypothetical protein STAN_2624 [Streptomyces sp. CBMAI 2042]
MGRHVAVGHDPVSPYRIVTPNDPA